MLLPVGNRPLLEYWIEACVDLGINEIRLVLGEGAYEIESYAGDGERWGVSIQYSFLKEEADPDSFPKRQPDQWENGLLYLRHPCFPARANKTLDPLAATGSQCWSSGETESGFLSNDSAYLNAFLSGTPLPESSALSCGLSLISLDTLQAYYQLNMGMVQGDVVNYLTPGYELVDNSYIGYNVILPPSCNLTPPLMVGNHVRLRPLASVGGSAVIGNHVVIDSQAEVRNSVILDGTYIGRNLEIDGKVVAGNLLMDPESGESILLDDPLLLSHTQSEMRISDVTRDWIEKLPAFILWVAMTPLYFLLRLILLPRKNQFRPKTVLDKRGQSLTLTTFHPDPSTWASGFMLSMNLDRWPALCAVLRGKLHLFGHAPIPAEHDLDRKTALPVYFPGAFYEELLEPDYLPPALQNAYALEYIHTRSLFRDLRGLIRVLFRRPNK
jgi:hypothetical protein